MALVKREPVKEPALNGLTPSVEQQILGMAKNLPNGSSAKCARMMNLTIAALKFLILRTESDAVRLQACKVVLELPPMQAKLGAMNKAILRDYHQHVHLEQGNKELTTQLVDLLGAANPAGIKALEAAESQIVPVKPVQTNEIP